MPRRPLLAVALVATPWVLIAFTAAVVSYR
jgi:hypothetical protein